MSVVTITNQITSQALRGQDVIVTANTSSDIENISVGNPAEISGQNVKGIVSFVDYYGRTFHVTPIQPNFSFSSTSIPGYLSNDEDIEVTIS